MLFFKTPKNPLKLLILCLFLAFSGSIGAMETTYGNLVPQPAWTQVAMNSATYEHVHAKTPITLWTDNLEGCVVTLLHLEHVNGQHTLVMCHFSHDKKSYNKYYLQELLAQLEHQNNIQNIKKASCIIIPPGIKEGTRLKPILDQEWKKMIVETIRAYIPKTSVQIEPYLFNTKLSGVKFALINGKLKVTIVNNSREQDIQNQNRLLVSHSYKDESACVRLAPLVLAAAGLAGYIAWHMS